MTETSVLPSELEAWIESKWDWRIHYSTDATDTGETWEDWFSLPVDLRAEYLGQSLVKAQVDPAGLTKHEAFLLGIAANDAPALQALDQYSIDANLDWEFSASARPAAISDALLVWSRINGADLNEINGIRNAGSAGTSQSRNPDYDPMTFWEEAALAGGALLLGLGATAGLVAAAPVASATSTQVGRWFATNPATKAVHGALQSVTRANGIPVDRTGILMESVYRQGLSTVGQGLRAASIKGSWGVLGTGAVIQAGDLTRALLSSPAEIAERQEQQDRRIKVADLERRGYTVERSGQILAAGEDIGASEVGEAVVIKDNEGNIISTEHADAIFADESIPDPFATPTGEGGELPAPNLVSDPGELAGAADQYRTTGGGGSSTDILAGLQAAIANASDQLSAEEEAKKRAARLQAIGSEIDQRYADNPYLGVDRDYWRVTARNTVQQPQYGSIRSADDVNQLGRMLGGATYRQNDIAREIADLSNLDLIRFQERAIEAGLIDPKNTSKGYFQFGTIDGQTAGAMSAAMMQANINGDKQTYEDALDGMIDQRKAYMERYGDPNAPPTWTPTRAYFAPDYATISQNTKALFRRQLGRDPNGWEMDLLADQFRSDHRAAYDAEMAGSRAQFEAEGRAQESGIPETPVVGEAIDPVARMAENFETTFSDEMDAKSRWADVKSKGRNLFGSLNKLGGA